MFLHADSEDCDQTGRMPRLIEIFTGHTDHFVGFVMRWLRYELPMLKQYHIGDQLTVHYCSLTRPLLFAHTT